MNRSKKTFSSTDPARMTSVMQPLIGGYLLYLAYQLLRFPADVQDVSPVLRWVSAGIFIAVGVVIILRYASGIMKPPKHGDLASPPADGESKGSLQDAKDN